MIPGVVLRDVIESDLPVFYEHQLDPEAVSMAAFPSRGRATFMAHWAKIMPDHSNILKTILFDAEVAGYIVSWDQSGKRQVGYWIGREFWGKGLATGALSSFLEVVVMRPLYAHVARHNGASRRVLEKCGFMVVGADGVMPEMGAAPVAEFILRLDPSVPEPEPQSPIHDRKSQL